MNNETKIIKAIAEYLGVEPKDLDRGAFLTDELGLGPIELNDLLANLANKFNVIFDSDDIENVHKVEDLIVLIEDNLID